MVKHARASSAILVTALGLGLGVSACGGGKDTSGGLNAAQKKSYCDAVAVYAKAKLDKSGSFDAQHRRQAEGAKLVLPLSPKDEKPWWERAVTIQSTMATGAGEGEAYAKSPLKDQDDPRYFAMKERCGVDLYEVG
jgi:hypothetical protein